MGCPSQVEINDNVVFSVTTHDPNTGVLTDADSLPSYRIYRDEDGTAIMTGTMSKLDDGNTTGFYTENIPCVAASGFQNGKTYTIYIEATVDGDTGGIAYGFKAVDPRATYAQSIAISGDIQNIGSSVDIAHAVWDEILTGATHNIPSSAGRRLRQLGDVVGGTVNDLAASATTFITDLTSAVNDVYDDQVIRFITGNLTGQVRPILSYIGSSKTIILDEALTEAPANGDAFDILPQHVHPLSQIKSGVWNYDTRTLTSDTNINYPTAVEIAAEVSGVLTTDHGAGSWTTADISSLTNYVLYNSGILNTIDGNVDIVNNNINNLLVYNTSSGVTLTSTTYDAISDAILKRNMSYVEDTATEHTLCTLVLAGLNSNIAGTTRFIKKTDGSAYISQTVTTDASATPITGVS